MIFDLCIPLVKYVLVSYSSVKVSVDHCCDADHKKRKLPLCRICRQFRTACCRISPICGTTILQWRHNERDGISNHQSHDCLLSRLFRHRSKKTWKLRVTGLCEGNSPVTGEFFAQKPVTRKMLSFVSVIMSHAEIGIMTTVSFQFEFQLKWIGIE